MADFVKFAKLRPLPEDNESVIRNAVLFVEETKPVEEPSEESGKEQNPTPENQPGSEG